MNSHLLLEAAAERTAFRERLVERGFSDDGDRLYGQVRWCDETSAAGSPRIVIQLPEGFPFGPPVVLLDHEDQAATTFLRSFHRARSNAALCLYGPDVPVETASWRDPDRLLEHVAGWFRSASAGWPGDDDTDLERYLEPSGLFVLYNTDTSGGGRGTFPISSNNGIIRVLPRSLPEPRPGARAQRGRPAMAWVGDLGVVAAPIRAWLDLKIALGRNGTRVEALIRCHHVSLLLLRYNRGTAAGFLAVRVASTSRGIELFGCESADESVETRRLRAGAPAAGLGSQRIAVVGCGAVGSYTADLLFRGGAVALTLIDPQLLRPGNLVRHVASAADVGLPKVAGVRNHLASIGLPTDEVRAVRTSLTTPREALELLENHSLVIDATGDERTTALLMAATEGGDTQLLSVCLQREGGIARVDRWPVSPGEQHLPPVPALGSPGVRERGCGDEVSLTPPHSVSAAASLVLRVAISDVSGRPRIPATMLEVLEAQLDAPYDRLGLQVAGPAKAPEVVAA